MLFGLRKRAPAASSEKEVRVRKRDLFRHFFSLSRERKLQRSNSAADNHDHDRKTLIPEPLRGTLRKHTRSRSTVKEEPVKPAAAAAVVPQVAEDDVGSEVQAEEPSSHDQRDLTGDDIPTLFTGAPAFSVEKSKGKRFPKVDFPHDRSVTIRDVSDSPQLSHEAFSAATLRPHLRQVGHRDDAPGSLVGYDIGVVEIPSMLSGQGLEPGTVGFDHFLEAPKSDSLRIDDDDDEAILNRELLETAPEKLGIKWLDQRLIYERLMELCHAHERYREEGGKKTILDAQSTGELYAHLFGKFLMPPRYDGSTGDPTGLKVQIETLMRILRIKGIWRDFSLVEWRIRLGQLLWDSDALEPADQNQYVGPSERDMLLLQILLASELLLRLDAISGLSLKDVTDKLHLTAAEVRNFSSLKTRKTDWDLVLAKRFMENIEIIEEAPAPLTPKRRGFLAALNVTRSEEQNDPVEPEYWLRPRNRERQLSGLLHFAETIGWTNLEEVRANLTAKLHDTATPRTLSIYGTPLATPLASPRSAKGERAGYFDDAYHRPHMSRLNSNRSIQLHPSVTSAPPTPQRPSLLKRDTSGTQVNANAGPPDIGGWLSRAYLTGLILPGEAISHFLISTLLENDKLAITALGASANLYGGFVLDGRSWWSKSCVAGRVLAAIDGVQECMGWISVPCVPDGFRDTWIDIANGTPSHAQDKKSKARLECGDSVARDSNFTGEKNIDELTGEDFTLPQDADQAPSTVRFSKLELRPERTASLLESQDSDAGRDSEPQHAYTAQLTFDVSDSTITLPLTYDIHFVTAMPCTPPTTASAIFKLRRLRRTTVGRGGKPVPVPVSSAHPLHISHKYRIITPTELLNSSSSSNSSPHLTPASSSISLLDETAASGEVLVIDARAPAGEEFPGASSISGTDASLLARAWCSDRGEHALVGRAGRTCVACCVREARALGLRIVVRV